MNYRFRYGLLLLLIIGLSAKGSAQKHLNGIVKFDVFAPFTGNVYASYQLYSTKKYFSPEIGLGYMGNWSSKYTGQAERSGYYARVGLFILNGTPVSDPKNIWRKLYIKPEIALFQHHAGYAYNSRKFNPTTGFYDDAVNKESYDIKGACVVVNFGKQIQFKQWVVDFSMGIGGMITKATHQKSDPNTLSKMTEFVFPIQGPFPIYSINTFTDMMQGGIRVGYKLY
jgi:hypothetical protein